MSVIFFGTCYEIHTVDKVGVKAIYRVTPLSVLQEFGTDEILFLDLHLFHSLLQIQLSAHAIRSIILTFLKNQLVELMYID